MNKQKLEKQAEALYADVRSFLDNTFDLIDQIHEPQKVAVPKFVAEWIERAKEESYNLSYAMSDDITPSKVDGWLFQDDYKNEETFAKAWIYGYEVEQERLYTVEIPNPHSDSLTVLEKIDDGTVLISQMDVFFYDWKNHTEYHLTEAEIKKDFEWAWDAGFAKEVGDD
ncbi:DUF1642 domain-containing protein [Streptococcus suis]|uniref:DUF1642 domain-containing protein n=1 Tax=Streptococcus suis TaxID=1307 RepID=UPI003756AFE4